MYLEALRYERTPEAVIHFSENCSQLTDYGYWFLLSTLWVSYAGWSELELWKRLFKARRQGRRECLMKPKEMEFYRLPGHRLRQHCFHVLSFLRSARLSYWLMAGPGFAPGGFNGVSGHMRACRARALSVRAVRPRRTCRELN